MLIASYLLQEPPSDEQLASYDPVTKWEFMVPTVPKELFLPRVVKFRYPCYILAPVAVLQPGAG